MVKAINIDYEVSGTKIFIPFTAICSLTNEEFRGDAIIEYHPTKKILEYIDIELFVGKITKNKLLTEDLAKLIFDEVAKSIKPKYLKVLIDVKHSEAHKPVQVWIEK